MSPLKAKDNRGPARPEEHKSNRVYPLVFKRDRRYKAPQDEQASDDRN